MQPTRSIVHWRNSTTHHQSPRRLRSLGKNEEFLESILAQHPELLGIDNRRSGIYGPFACFRQLAMKTPADRDVYPDIVLLASSGHFIVVEVKLGDNAELKDRDVIAQIIDYASSFAVLDDKQLVDLFVKTPAVTPSWSDFVSSQFPEDENPSELARVLRDRIGAGEINLVIACDQVPIGLPEIVKGIATQQSTSFALDLVEITPYSDPESPDEITFVPNNRLSTEIVSRTTVTVTYQGTAPDVSVETAAGDEREVRATASKTSTARVLPPEEVEQVVLQAGDPFEIELLEFCKEHSAGGEFVSPAVKSNATFGFFLSGRKRDGKKAKNMLFYLTHGWAVVYLNLAVAKSLVDELVVAEFDQRLKDCFGMHVDTNAPAPPIKIELLRDKFVEFKQLMLWFKEQTVLQATRIG